MKMRLIQIATERCCCLFVFFFDCQQMAFFPSKSTGTEGVASFLTDSIIYK